MKAFSHSNLPTLFEVINYFSMIDGHTLHHAGLGGFHLALPHLIFFQYHISAML